MLYMSMSISASLYLGNPIALKRVHVYVCSISFSSCWLQFVVSLLLAEHLSLVDTPFLEVDSVGVDLDMVEGFGNTLLVVLDV